ncbi:hypothetical protein HHK36_002668 [Tetracentron sinense]|uniref:non-specific serine/threonine protein kinase n=1 Tax=Tetracentron sinense TaxID=13715 RepID=A0A835DNJ6_TETSI|nr:hypothetical protein HHK36_002668 [Tetracentron sinense]
MNFLQILQYAILAVLLSSQSPLRVADSASLSNLTDKESLISFKSLITTNPSNDILSSWNQNSTFCNWTGIVCDEFSQRVVGLDLSGLQLTGTISPHLANLSFLRFLHLQDNQFTGPLPVRIGDLSRLQVLNISSNRINGAIPPNISRCSELQTLDFMGNQILGRIPADLDRLSKLQVLNMGRNQLSGPIPPSIGNISSLTTLNLATNTLSGAIPGDLGRLQNLTKLELSINNLTGTVPSSIYNISSLVFIALASNKLWGEIPRDVGDKLPNLIDFNFCINEFTGSIPGSLHNLTNIQSIRMASNFLDGSVPPGLGNLPDLRMYNIGFNRIVSSGDDGLSFITSLRNSTRLEFLAMDGNLLEGVIPESIGDLSTVLSKLYMGGNKIYGTIPPSIGRLSNLALLNLSHNSLSGEIPLEISQLKELQMLGLAGNEISGEIPSSLGDLTKLNKLELFGNKLVGRIPTSFGNLQKLLSMDLSNNKLNGSIPREILSLSSLSTLLNLSKNSLNGPLPQEFGNLENVVTIDLSHNRLSGSIPNSIQKCKSLEELFMASNSFSGSIPDTLAEVKGLETLDLSSNQFSGPIPRDLQELQALQFLNLSFNNLEGEVPKDGLFRNLSRVHLEGNSKLCWSLGCENSRGHGRRSILIPVIVPIAVTMALSLLVAFLFYARKSTAKIAATAGDQSSTTTTNGLKGSIGYIPPEYGMGGKLSSRGDVYSYGVMLLELFTGKSPTHESFGGGISLTKWVQSAFPTNIMEVLDPELLQQVADLHHEGRSISPEVQRECLVTIMEVGLSCTVDSPDRRMSMRDVLIFFFKSIDEHGLNIAEYSMGGKLSSRGDVYSYGVMLLELFIGKSPTHESFGGGISLTKWVQSAFPTNIMEVLDPELLQQVADLHHEGRSISPEVQPECLVTIMEVGLSCTVDSPDRRISMRDVLVKLLNTRDTLLNPLSSIKGKNRTP